MEEQRSPKPRVAGSIPARRAMATKIDVPFTPEQVEYLEKYQTSQTVHPYTCRNRDKPGHVWDEKYGDKGALEPCEKGLYCPTCNEYQTWAWDHGDFFMTYSEMFDRLKGNDDGDPGAPTQES